MTVNEVIKALDLEVAAGRSGLGREIKWGYASDLLSDVMAHALEGTIWVTSQAHQNVVAVALVIDAACVVITEGIKPASDTIKRAESEGIPVLLSDLSTFEVVGRLYQLGVRGGQRS